MLSASAGLPVGDEQTDIASCSVAPATVYRGYATAKVSQTRVVFTRVSSSLSPESIVMMHREQRVYDSVPGILRQAHSTYGILEMSL